MPDIHGSVVPARLHESRRQIRSERLPCDRSRLFTCLPCRPGKSLRVDPSAGLGMTKKRLPASQTTTFRSGGGICERYRFQCHTALAERERASKRSSALESAYACSFVGLLAEPRRC